MLALHLSIQLALSQALVTWVDAEGVTHVAPPHEAPRNARPLDARVSVIPLDSRTSGPGDGGVRAADAAWWDQQWRTARARLSEAERTLEEREREVRRAAQPVCATATAEAVAEAPVVTVVNGRRVFTPSPAKTTARVVESQTTCRDGDAPPSLLRERSDARLQVDAAKRALEELRAAARASGVTWLL